MSDPSKAASTGAKAAQKSAEGKDVSVVDATPDEDSGATAWGRARQRLSEAGTTVGGKVTDLKDRAVVATASDGTSPVPGTRRTRRARLRLARLDPWSVMKTAFLFTIAGGIVFFIATWVVWGIINASGVFDAVNKAVTDLASHPSSETVFRLEDYVNTHKVLGFAAMISALNVVLLTALATLFSFLYNLAATVIGGLEVTLAED